MRALVRVRLWDGSVRELAPGDLIGRLRTAALQVDDARISEAHAMVSLRGGELKLLALRRPVALDGRPVGEVTLEPGRRLELVPGLGLEVLEVHLPDEVLALEGDGLARQVLPGVCSLKLGPAPRLVARYVPDAAAWLWTDGPGWRAQVGDAPARPIGPGDVLEVQGRSFRAVAVPLGHAAQVATRLEGGVGEPLRLVARFDSVHVHRGSAPPVVLTGIAARIVSELVACGAPVGWEALAREIWGDGAHRDGLRSKLDVALVRLRARLREGRVRPDLVRSDGTGLLELVLYDGDVVEDQL